MFPSSLSLLSPCTRSVPRLSVLSASFHDKPKHFLTRDARTGKYKGRLEYLNRGDPFDQDNTARKVVVEKESARKHLPNNTRAYLWGNGELGALGQPGFLSPKKKKGEPRKNVLHKMRRPFISSLGNYYDLSTAACGYGFTLFATKHKEKQVFGTGLNDSGQIGYHRRLNKDGRQVGKPLEVVVAPAPVYLPLVEGEKVTAMAAGRAHSLVLTSHQRVLALGNNGYGQCGRIVVEEEDYIRKEMAHVMEVERVKSVVCGQDHSIMLTDEGKVYSCGWGADGQTGLGHYQNTGEPTRVRGDVEGEVVVKVACAADCVLALTDNGSVFGWGNSEYGQFMSVTHEQQLSYPTHLPFQGLGKVVDIASGGTTCMLLTEDGKVYVWGYGILGLGPNLDTVTEPVELPGVLLGRNSFSPNSVVTAVYCGLGHQAALNSEGDLYVWGKNRGGCLGLNTDQDRFFPMKVAIGGRVKHVSMGVDHMVAIAKPWMNK